MELHGTVQDNLVAAVRSVRRFRGHPVHADTLQHWTDLLHHARREPLGDDPGHTIEQLIVELETELAERASPSSGAAE